MTTPRALIAAIGSTLASARAAIDAPDTSAIPGMTLNTAQTVTANKTWTPGVLAAQTPIAFHLTGAANTANTATVECPDVYLQLNRTVQFATGAVASQRAVKILAPTYAFVGASTITTAATLYVDAAPAAGANATLTNSWALWVDAGNTRLDGGLALTPAVVAGSVPTALSLVGAANTTNTATTEVPDVLFNLGRTVEWATGAITSQRFVKILAPTIAFVAGSTVTNAATLYVDAAPAAGANATLTNSYSVWVDAGTTRLDGTVLFNGAITADTTDGSATPGAIEINKPSGKCAVAIGAASVVVTNSLVTAASHVICTLQFIDATFTQILSVVPGAGSFTITGNAVATAATKIAFLVVN